jgi:hypothetical protein
MSATAAPPTPAPVRGSPAEASPGAMTAFEVRDYRRRQLEMAVASFGTKNPVPPVRGDLQAWALVRMGCPARVPIPARLSAIGTELAKRGAGIAEPARLTS